MIVRFRVVGDSKWYYTKASESKDWKFRDFTDSTLGYICGYKSIQDVDLGDEDAGVWHNGKYIVSFKELK